MMETATYLAPHDAAVPDTIVDPSGRQLTIPAGYVHVGEISHPDDDGEVTTHGDGHAWLDIHVTKPAAFARLASATEPCRLLVVSSRGEDDDLIHHARFAAHAYLDTIATTPDEPLTVTMRGQVHLNDPDPWYREFWAGPGIKTVLQGQRP